MNNTDWEYNDWPEVDINGNVFADSLAEDKENNNYRSNSAKEKLLKKYNDISSSKVEKSQCILHHLNGDHNNDTNLENDVLLIANSREDAIKAHNLLHKLCYAYLGSYLRKQLEDTGAKFFFWPDTEEGPQSLFLSDILTPLIAHKKQFNELNNFDAVREAHDSEQDLKDYIK